MTIRASNACVIRAFPLLCFGGQVEGDCGVTTKPMRYGRSKFAFSLIEMLVVIAMITLLIAILQPSLTRAKEIARRSKCGSNLRQTGIAHQNFADDHKGSMAPGQAATGDSGMGIYAVYVSGMQSLPEFGSYRAHGIIGDRGYITDARVFYCPSWKGYPLQYDKSLPPGGGWPASGVLPAGQTWIQTNYHYRSTFGGSDPANWRPANFGGDPSHSALMADAFSDPNRGVDVHHQDGYNTLFIDSHVNFKVDLEDFVRDYNSGFSYHAGTADYILMEDVWQQFFDE